MRPSGDSRRKLMRLRALGELSGFAPFSESVAGICTRLLIRMRTLPFTMGAGIGFVTSCAAAVRATNRQAAHTIRRFVRTRTFLKLQACFQRNADRSQRQRVIACLL